MGLFLVAGWGFSDGMWIWPESAVQGKVADIQADFASGEGGQV
jgi:hypothetical protein